MRADQHTGDSETTGGGGKGAGLRKTHQRSQQRGDGTQRSRGQASGH